MLAWQAELDADQLDVLAILFTCVKVLFVGGAVRRVQALIQARSTLPTSCAVTYALALTCCFMPFPF